MKQFSCTPKLGSLPRSSTARRGESLRYHSSHITSVCVCKQVHAVCVCVCARCCGSMLDIGGRQSWVVPGVMVTYRGRPSVWYSAALWGLISLTSSGTPCTLFSQSFHPVHQLCENNDEIICRRSTHFPMFFINGSYFLHVFFHKFHINQ